MRGVVEGPAENNIFILKVENNVITEVKELKIYSDEKNNKIIYEGSIGQNILITFKGSNNTLHVDNTARIKFLRVGFYCSNSNVTIGSLGSISVDLQLGEDSSVSIGNQCYFTAKCYMTAAEGTHIKMGDACIIAVGAAVRTNDSHPIFDIKSGNRVNISKDVTIGNHVWLGERAVVQKGAHIGDGSVIGLNSIVTSRIPNNCIAAGTPAKVLKRNIAWEPPHLVYAEPYYKPDASCIKKSQYWNETVDVLPED